MLNMADLRIIWTSDPIVNGPVAARSALPAAFKDDMKRFHLALPKSHPDIYRQIERFVTGHGRCTSGVHSRVLGGTSI